MPPTLSTPTKDEVWYYDYQKDVSKENESTNINFVFEDACLCSNFVSVCYKNGTHLNPQTNDQVQLFIDDESFKVHSQISSITSDTHCIIFYSQAKHKVVVAFRGSYSTKNWQNNLKYALKTHYSSVNWKKYNESNKQYSPFTQGDLLPKVHKGMFRSYCAIRDLLFISLDKLLSSIQEPHPQILVCGHSLGGSLACLFSFDLVRKMIVSSHDLTVFTYGSPWLGNESFQIRYDDAVPRTFHFVNPDDPVPRILSRPFFNKYRPHGVPVIIQPDGTLDVNPSRKTLMDYFQQVKTNANRHKIREYVKGLMKWCVIRNMASSLKPFWNQLVLSVHNLEDESLMDPILLRFLLPAPVMQNWKTAPISSATVRTILADSLERRDNHSESKLDQLPFIEIVIQSVVFIEQAQVVASPIQTPTTRKTQRGQGKKKKEETPYAIAASQNLSDFDSNSHHPPADDDHIYVQVACRSTDIEEDDEDGELTIEVPRGTEGYLGGLDQKIFTFGGKHSFLDLKNDVIVLKVYQQPTKCKCTRSNVRKQLAQAFKSKRLAEEETTKDYCAECMVPVLLSEFRIPVSSVYGSLSNKKSIMDLTASHGPGLKISLCNDKKLAVSSPMISRKHTRLERVVADPHLPQYAENSNCVSQFVYSMFPSHLFQIKMKILHTVVGHGSWFCGPSESFCKIKIQGKNETRIKKRIPKIHFNDYSSSKDALEDVRKHQFIFGNDDSVLLTGFEDIIIKVFYMDALGTLKLEGIAVVELQRIFGELIRQHQNEGSTYQLAKWFKIRGSTTKSRILIGMDLSDSPVKIELDHSELMATKHRNSLMEGRRFLYDYNYSLELVLIGLRNVSSYIEHVSCIVSVSDEFDPNEKMTIKSSGLAATGLISPPRRFAFGTDPTRSLEGNEHVLIQLMNEDTKLIFAETFLRVQDLLEENVQHASWVPLILRSSSKIREIKGYAPEMNLQIKISQVEY